jgi:hypothetical protein
MKAEAYSPLTDLAEVIDDFTRSQWELLQYVREFRVKLRDTAPFLVDGPTPPDTFTPPTAYIPPTPTPAKPPDTFTPPTAYIPPTPTPAPPLPSTETSPPTPSDPSPPEATLWVTTAPTLPTNHDYDYFTDLDKKLAQLEADLVKGLGLDLDNPDPTTP